MLRGNSTSDDAPNETYIDMAPFSFLCGPGDSYIELGPLFWAIWKSLMSWCCTAGTALGRRR